MTFIDPQYQCNRCKKIEPSHRSTLTPSEWIVPDGWLVVRYGAGGVHLCSKCVERALEPARA